MPSDFGWFLPCRWTFEVNASVVLWMNPLHLISWFLKGIEATLRPLDSDFLILRNCIQRFDHWIHSLAVPCRHLCDTYLKGKKQHSLIWTGWVCIDPCISIEKGPAFIGIHFLLKYWNHISILHREYKLTVITINTRLYGVLKVPEKDKTEEKHT